jgi:hypothetical protein
LLPWTWQQQQRRRKSLHSLDCLPLLSSIFAEHCPSRWNFSVADLFVIDCDDDDGDDSGDDDGCLCAESG